MNLKTNFLYLLLFIGVIFSSCDKENINEMPGELPEGAVAYYSFDGNANNGISTMYNGTVEKAQLVTGRDGKSKGAYYFDGDSYIDFGDVPVGDTSMTISIWVKFDEQPAKGMSYRFMSKREVCGAGHFFDMAWNTSDATPNYIGVEARADYETSNVTGHVQSGQIFLSEWTHFVFVKNDVERTTKIYINGVRKGNTTWSHELNRLTFENSGPLTLGHSPCLNGTTVIRFKGIVDDMVVYDRALTEAEITELGN